MDKSKKSPGTLGVEEISEDLPGDSGDSAMQITKSIQSLSTSLLQLSKQTESIKVEEHTAKQPPIEEVLEDGAFAAHC